MHNTNENEVKGTKLKIKNAGISEDQHTRVSESLTTKQPYTAVKGSCSLVPPAF